MKKLFITIAFVAATMFASAQLYVGGSLGLGTQSGKDEFKADNVTVTVDQPKQLNFTFNPEVGFMFNDNMGVGINLLFGLSQSKQKDDDYTATFKTTNIGFAPYFRYVFAEVDNFKFYADARVSYLMSTPKGKIEQGGQSLEITGDKTTTLGVGIVPGMAYQLTDNISMNCALNILELGFQTTKTVDKDHTEEIDGVVVTGDLTTKTNEFGFGVNYATPITIGFFYTF
ncbi:MAG: outer membrane beta-barrel protein [Bacteroidales bacterium]|nr:outer membrane beta-barrel protein [Bacteroidales bacterium]